MDGLTPKELSNITKAPKYVIDYLRDSRRLPILKRSTGRGIPNIYAPEAVDIVKNHMKKNTHGE